MTNESLRKVTLVTGASMGIGLELAKNFAKNGHDLVLVARSAERLETIAADFREKFGIYVKVVVKDLIQPESPEELYAELNAESLAVDILVNNAGFAGHGEFYSTPLNRELDMIQLNVTTLVHLTKLFLRDMRKRGSGKILNVASTAGFQPGPLMAVYYATKAFVLSFSEAIREELIGSGISVTALCPGATRTHFADRAEVGDTRIFKFTSMDVDVVGREAYAGLMKGKAIVMPGFINKFYVFLVRLGPRVVVRKVVKFISQRVKH